MTSDNGVTRRTQAAGDFGNMRGADFAAAADDVRAIVSANVIHIAPWDVSAGLIAGAAHWLRTGDPLILYGPFHRNGQATSDGNARFDAELRQRDPRWGIRDLDREVIPTATTAGLALDSIHPMPANNLTAVFRRA